MTQSTAHRARARRDAVNSLARQRREPRLIPEREVIEGAGAALCGFVAMIATAALGLGALGTASVVPLGQAVAAVVSLAVGGSVKLSGGGGRGVLSLGIDGNLDGMPFGVTLAGTVTLGLLFFFRLRGLRVTPQILAARTAAAGATWFVLLLIVSWAGRGTIELPASVTSRMMPKAASGAGGGGLGALMGGGLGGGTGGGLGGSMVPKSVDFHVDVPATLILGLAWLLVVLTIGALAARRPRFTPQFATGSLRTSAGPALSATVTVLVTVVITLACLAVAAVAAKGGGHTGAVVGAIVLMAPNALFAVLATGVGTPWTLSYGTTRAAGSPLSALMGGADGGGTPGVGPGAGGSATTPHTMSLADIGGGGLSLHLGLLLAALAVFAACGALTVTRTPVPTRRDGSPLTTPTRRCVKSALVVATVWALVLTVADLCCGPALGVQVSVDGMSLLRLHAGAGGPEGAALGPLPLVVLLAAGTAAGAGGLACEGWRLFRSRGLLGRLPRKATARDAGGNGPGGDT